MHELDLRETQLLCTEMLCEFDAFCAFHHLEYRLDYGSLLGAVRHKGFIPWDDDIDVSMPRPDYQRLVELAVGKESVESLPGHLHFEDYKTGLPKSFIRLFNSHTVVELSYYYPKKPINELAIDIFPMDGMPSNRDEIRKRYEHAHELAALANEKIELLSSVPTMREKLHRLRRKPKVMLRSFSSYCEELEAYLLEYPYEQSEYVGSASNFRVSWKPDAVMHKEDYEASVFVEFEGMQVKAVSCWDEYLSNFYGDYMTSKKKEHRHIQRVFIK